MNNKVLNTVGAKIQDVASSVINGKFVQNVIPTADELNKTIASNSKLSNSLHNTNIQKGLATMLQGIDVPEEEAIKIAKSVKVNNYNDAIDSFGDNISQYTDKPVEKIRERAKNITKEEISKGIDPDTISKKDKILKYPGAYFMNSDKQVRNARIAAAAGIYAGAAVSGRYLSGGTLTTDNYGRKDIAGIPFI